MNYFLALVLPPLALYLSGKRLQVVISLVLFVMAGWTLWLANEEIFMGGYAAGPVLYVLSLIHAFVFVHRFYQKEAGEVHPHRGTETQSKPSDKTE